MSLFSKYLKNRHRSELVTPAGERGGRGEGEGRDSGGGDNVPQSKALYPNQIVLEK